MSATKNLELHDRAVGAVARYLGRLGLDVLDTGWSCTAGAVDAVALDPIEDEIVFVDVRVLGGILDGFPDDAADADERRRLEAIAAHYLAEHDHSDVRVRFDRVSVMVVGEDRAFIKHRVNCVDAG